ncbi:uncharacterized protein LOC124927779 [Impatiens glandulifera]|uniref:uncharacterized protein LOC124927779 n=1 Tax=Impatiens glandulifera TaxID=253017 RepID=UPI001FB10907|nr:uncharacterized protein LOC124927779 [Impatiens glandulifera]
MDVWSWISNLSNSGELLPDPTHSPLVLQLATSKKNQVIQLRANPTSGSNLNHFVTFSVSIHGFHSFNGEKTLWVSDTCSLSSSQPFLPLLLQLLQELISLSPTAQDSTCRRSDLLTLNPKAVSWVMDSHSPESFSGLFHLLFLTRIFWLCVLDVPAEVGTFYFHSLLAPNIETFTTKQSSILKAFFFSVGVDVELCVMRTVGYMLAKWLILKEVTGIGLPSPSPSPNLGFSYATESHGLWILKGYVPVLGMDITRNNGNVGENNLIEAKESLLKYALAHQQLEVVIQMEYTIRYYDGYILVNANVDNIRVHVARLGFRSSNSKSGGGDNYYAEERHFPSRMRVWVGPDIGSTYLSVGGLSLGKSTHNQEKEVETQRVMKGSFGNSKAPRVKAATKTATKARTKAWRWDQDAEGNVAVYDAVLCDTTTGIEVAAWSPGSGGERPDVIRRRSNGGDRNFTKSGGWVVAGGGGDDGGGRAVGWRLNKEVEGSVMRWRMGCQVWLSYWPSEVRSEYFETRCVEWCDEVDLPLLPA